jgi:undecaprenyl-diphosphatase
MDMFPAIGFSILYGLLAYLPIEATVILRPYSVLLEADFLNPGLTSVLSLACTISLFGYFRHDCASLISGLLRVILFRNQPETVDESLPFFILVAFGSFCAGQFALARFSPLDFSTPAFFSVGAVVTLLVGLLLSLSGYLSRRNRRAVDWTLLDAIIVGFFQLFAWIPGFGVQAATLMGGSFRNFRYDALIRFSFFLLIPVYLTNTINGFHAINFESSQPLEGMSWLTLVICFLSCLMTSAITLDVIKKSSERPGLNLAQFFLGTLGFRVALATGLFLMFWFKYL